MLVSDPKRTELEQKLTLSTDKSTDTSDTLRQIVLDFLHADYNGQDLATLNKKLEEFRFFCSMASPQPAEITRKVGELGTEILDMWEYIQDKGLDRIYKAIERGTAANLEKKKATLRNELREIAMKYHVSFSNYRAMMNNIISRVEEVSKSEGTIEGTTDELFAQKQKEILYMQIQQDRDTNFYLNLLKAGVLILMSDGEGREEAANILSTFLDTNRVKKYGKAQYIRKLTEDLRKQYRGHISPLIYRVGKWNIVSWPLSGIAKLCGKEYVSLAVGLKRTGLNLVREGVDGLAYKVTELEALSVENMSDSEILQINKELEKRKLPDELVSWSQLLHSYQDTLSGEEEGELRNGLQEYGEKIKPFIEQYNIKTSGVNGFLDLTCLIQIREKAVNMPKK